MNHEKHCIGCGVLLQDENVLTEGYTTSLENDICQRCFRVKNYGDYQVITKSNDEYLEILKEVGKTKDLVLYITDILNLEKDLNAVKEYLPNKMILVINKRDLLPKSIKDDKIIAYVKNMGLDFCDVLLISANKNYKIDTLLKKIKYYQTTKNVYVVGHTNAGKSTLINKIMKSYSDNVNELTISPMPSTTLNKISISISEFLILIDTPGLVDRGNILNYVENDVIKRINAKKEIKPKTYQIKKGQCLVIDNLFRIDYIEGFKNSFIVYASNELKVKRYNAGKCLLLKDLNKTTLNVKFREDLVINGLGFIKIMDKAVIDIYIDKNIDVFLRKSLI